MYKSDKRQKELKRKKKQEEKALKRQGKAGAPSDNPETTGPTVIQPGPSEDAPESARPPGDAETGDN